MEGLTPKQKGAIQLCYFKEMTEIEVAHKLGVTRGVIHSRRIRGIKKLEKISSEFKKLDRFDYSYYVNEIIQTLIKEDGDENELASSTEK